MISQSLRSVAISITESSQVGETRRLVSGIAKQLEFDAETVERVRIVATEAANNLAKYARDGQIIFRPLWHPSARGLEVLSLDRGPGMADVPACLRDGFSSAGTSGTGLGSIVRQSTSFDVYSQPKSGTALVSRIWTKPVPSSAKLEIGAVCLPMAGEEACGDNWIFQADKGRYVIAVADGLGHGPHAAQAANEAMRIFQEKSGCKAADILQAVHAGLRSTRGAAVSVAEIDLTRRTIAYAGVGNIAGIVLAESSSRNMVSHNGTLGGNAQRFQEFTYPWPKDGLIILHSDGLMSRWSLDEYPGLKNHHPSLIAGILHRDFRRDRDDTTVLAIKERPTQPS